LGIGSSLFAASSLFNVARSQEQDDPQKATPTTTATPSATAAAPKVDVYDVKLKEKGTVVSATIPLQNFTLPELNMHLAFVEDAEHVKNAAWLSALVANLPGYHEQAKLVEGDFQRNQDQILEMAKAMQNTWRLVLNSMGPHTEDVDAAKNAADTAWFGENGWGTLATHLQQPVKFRDTQSLALRFDFEEMEWDKWNKWCESYNAYRAWAGGENYQQSYVMRCLNDAVKDFFLNSAQAEERNHEYLTALDRVVESQFGDLVVVAAALKQSIKRLDTELTNNIAAEAAGKAKAELEEKAAATQKTEPTDEEQETKEEQQEKEEEKEDSTSFLATEADWETAPGSTTSVPGLMAPMAHAHVMAAHAIMRQSRAALVEIDFFTRMFTITNLTDVNLADAAYDNYKKRDLAASYSYSSLESDFGTKVDENLKAIHPHITSDSDLVREDDVTRRIDQLERNAVEIYHALTKKQKKTQMGERMITFLMTRIVQRGQNLLKLADLMNKRIGQRSLMVQEVVARELWSAHSQLLYATNQNWADTTIQKQHEYQSEFWQKYFYARADVSVLLPSGTDGKAASSGYVRGQTPESLFGESVTDAAGKAQDGVEALSANSQKLLTYETWKVLKALSRNDVSSAYQLPLHEMLTSALGTKRVITAEMQGLVRDFFTVAVHQKRQLAHSRTQMQYLNTQANATEQIFTMLDELGDQREEGESMSDMAQRETLSYLKSLEQFTEEFLQNEQDQTMITLTSRNTDPNDRWELLEDKAGDLLSAMKGASASLKGNEMFQKFEEWMNSLKPKTKDRIDDVTKAIELYNARVRDLYDTLKPEMTNLGNQTHERLTEKVDELFANTKEFLESPYFTTTTPERYYIVLEHPMPFFVQQLGKMGLTMHDWIEYLATDTKNGKIHDVPKKTKEFWEATRQGFELYRDDLRNVVLRNDECKTARNLMGIALQELISQMDWAKSTITDPNTMESNVEYAMRQLKTKEKQFGAKVEAYVGLLTKTMGDIRKDNQDNVQDKMLKNFKYHRHKYVVFLEETFPKLVHDSFAGMRAKTDLIWDGIYKRLHMAVAGQSVERLVQDLLAEVLDADAVLFHQIFGMRDRIIQMRSYALDFQQVRRADFYDWVDDVEDNVLGKQKDPGLHKDLKKQIMQQHPRLSSEEAEAKVRQVQMLGMQIDQRDNTQKATESLDALHARDKVKKNYLCDRDALTSMIDALKEHGKDSIRTGQIVAMHKRGDLSRLTGVGMSFGAEADLTSPRLFKMHEEIEERVAPHQDTDWAQCLDMIEGKTIDEFMVDPKRRINMFEQVLDVTLTARRMVQGILRSSMNASKDGVRLVTELATFMLRTPFIVKKPQVAFELAEKMKDIAHRFTKQLSLTLSRLKEVGKNALQDVQVAIDRLGMRLILTERINSAKYGAQGFESYDERMGALKSKQQEAAAAVPTTTSDDRVSGSTSASGARGAGSSFLTLDSDGEFSSPEVQQQGPSSRRSTSSTTASDDVLKSDFHLELDNESSDPARHGASVIKRRIAVQKLKVATHASMAELKRRRLQAVDAVSRMATTAEHGLKKLRGIEVEAGSKHNPFHALRTAALAEGAESERSDSFLALAEEHTQAESSRNTGKQMKKKAKLSTSAHQQAAAKKVSVAYQRHAALSKQKVEYKVVQRDPVQEKVVEKIKIHYKIHQLHSHAPGSVLDNLDFNDPETVTGSSSGEQLDDAYDALVNHISDTEDKLGQTALKTHDMHTELYESFYELNQFANRMSTMVEEKLQSARIAAGSLLLEQGLEEDKMKHDLCQVFNTAMASLPKDGNEDLLEDDEDLNATTEEDQQLSDEELQAADPRVDAVMENSNAELELPKDEVVPGPGNTLSATPAATPAASRSTNGNTADQHAEDATTKTSTATPPLSAPTPPPETPVPAPAGASFLEDPMAADEPAEAMSYADLERPSVDPSVFMTDINLVFPAYAKMMNSTDPRGAIQLMQDLFCKAPSAVNTMTGVTPPASVLKKLGKTKARVKVRGVAVKKTMTLWHDADGIVTQADGTEVEPEGGRKKSKKDKKRGKDMDETDSLRMTDEAVKKAAPDIAAFAAADTGGPDGTLARDGNLEKHAHADNEQADSFLQRLLEQGQESFRGASTSGSRSPQTAARLQKQKSGNKSPLFEQAGAHDSDSFHLLKVFGLYLLLCVVVYAAMSGFLRALRLQMEKNSKRGLYNFGAAAGTGTLWGDKYSSKTCTPEDLLRADPEDVEVKTARSGDDGATTPSDDGGIDMDQEVEQLLDARRRGAEVSENTGAASSSEGSSSSSAASSSSSSSKRGSASARRGGKKNASSSAGVSSSSSTSAKKEGDSAASLKLRVKAVASSGESSSASSGKDNAVEGGKKKAKGKGSRPGYLGSANYV